MIEVKIIGSVNLGGGLSYHTEYKIEVSSAGESWLVYRRYKDFEMLHTKLNDHFESETALADQGIIIPIKFFGGSVLSTTQSLVNERITLLQRYLDQILERNDLVETEYFKQFLDFTNKGASGIQITLGKSKIMKEQFAFVKHSKNSIPGILWKIRYVTVLKSGKLVVLKSIYDDISKALVSISLKDKQYQIVPKASNNSVSITSSSEKIQIGFSSPSESAFWIRSVSDFALNEKEQDFKATATSPTETNNKVNLNPQHQQQQTVEEIHAKGTGNTQDELSTMLGI